MSIVRIALANIPYPASPQHSIELATQAIEQAGANSAAIICFPEAYIPGYRGLGMMPPAPDQAFQDLAWSEIAEAAKSANIAVILGTERIVDNEVRISALVINSDGSLQGFQDKVQLDPSEEPTYTAGNDPRQVFEAGELRFGIAICHEGFRYPETVRAAARQGAHIVFHPHFSNLEEGAYRPTTFAEAGNTFHEKSMLCRAAENTIFIATVNYASDGSPTTSAVIDPQGRLITFQPYGEEGILYADIDTSLATGFLAKRLTQSA
jgi:predicted amidohydrolase